ncbi:MAG: N-acetyl-gamma-glutamyl-phosphate reductase [Novosphingobium sp.]|nr:N-acetyl-gamma-glutamyl-phosphate reductase [Novosphingobium sp.]
MSSTVFIDGAAGTTGLEIVERLSERPEFSLLVLDEVQRKDANARRDAYHSADFAVLCLPDEAAREAVKLAEGSKVRIVDASSAHRVSSGWVYGFPEVIGREQIAQARLVSNPGCYPTGFLALMAPLVRSGMLPADWPYTCNAVSGYSGGGKALIERFEQGDGRNVAFRAYGLTLAHKHVPEMQVHAGLVHAPVFAPAVVPAYRGMIVEVPLPLAAMPDAGSAAAMLDALTNTYRDCPLIEVSATVPDELVLHSNSEPRDGMTLYVAADGNGSQARLVAVLDNLCKGASSGAVQNLNLMAGLPETAGLLV